MTRISYSSYIRLALMLFMLSACGSAPVITDSKRLSTYTKKATTIEFVYRLSDLRNSNDAQIQFNANGYLGFGQSLANQAPKVFGQFSVSVSDTRQIEGKEPLRPTLTGNGNHSNDPTTILLIYATEGKISINRHAMSASYVFDAQLIDPSSMRPYWQASIDTSTWSGKDFVQSGVNKTLYNDAYAEQLLKALAERMKQDGLI